MLILNSKGKPITLSPQEQFIADALQRQYDSQVKGGLMMNAIGTLGADINFTNLTQIQSRVIEQKFFRYSPADYVPVRVGTGAWATNLLSYVSYNVSGGFSKGIINLGSNMSRLEETDVALTAVNVPTVNWAKGLTWSLPELATAQRTGNWDLVTAKEKSRKTDWDLGIQEVAQWGIPSISGITGLLTLANVSANTSIITKSITSMTATELSAFVGALIADYQVNAAYTAMPDRFVIPQTDYNGLASPSSDQFPIKSKLQLIQEAFAAVTRNPNFQILPSPYADKLINAAIPGLNKNRYVLYNSDEDTLRMDIPVDYTATLQNSINGFQFQNVGYGQFTGVYAYRPKLVRYYDYT